jgi:hypothetical protein
MKSGFEGYADIVEFLLSKGAEINTYAPEMGATALPCRETQAYSHCHTPPPKNERHTSGIITMK